MKLSDSDFGYWPSYSPKHSCVWLWLWLRRWWFGTLKWSTILIHISNKLSLARLLHNFLFSARERPSFFLSLFPLVWRPYEWDEWDTFILWINERESERESAKLDPVQMMHRKWNTNGLRLANVLITLSVTLFRATVRISSLIIVQDLQLF